MKFKKVKSLFLLICVVFCLGTYMHATSHLSKVTPFVRKLKENIRLSAEIIYYGVLCLYKSYLTSDGFSPEAAMCAHLNGEIKEAKCANNGLNEKKENLGK